MHISDLTDSRKYACKTLMKLIFYVYKVRSKIKVRSIDRISFIFVSTNLDLDVSSLAVWTSAISGTSEFSWAAI